MVFILCKELIILRNNVLSILHCIGTLKLMISNFTDRPRVELSDSQVMVNVQITHIELSITLPLALLF